MCKVNYLRYINLPLREREGPAPTAWEGAGVVRIRPTTNFTPATD
jgi:hypothetical protein